MRDCTGFLAAHVVGLDGDNGEGAVGQRGVAHQGYEVYEGEFVGAPSSSWCASTSGLRLFVGRIFRWGRPKEIFEEYDDGS